MAVNLNTAIRFRRNTALPESLRFRRKEKTRSSKIKRRFKIKLRHIIISALFLAGFFFLLQQTSLFLMSWDQLKVKEFEVITGNKLLRDSYAQAFAGVEWGNILFVNIQKIQALVEASPAVKEARIRKVFPSTLEIQVKERKPVARILKKEILPIDRDNVILTKPFSSEMDSLPLITDREQFQNDYLIKMDSVWNMWDSLSETERDLIDLIDVKDADNICIQLKSETTKIILGKKNFSHKIHFYVKNREIFDQFGTLEYVDLRFQDRIYIKPSNRTGNSISMRR